MHEVDRERVVLVNKGLVVRIVERNMNPFTIDASQFEERRQALAFIKTKIRFWC